MRGGERARRAFHRFLLLCIASISVDDVSLNKVDSPSGVELTRIFLSKTSAKSHLIRTSGGQSKTKIQICQEKDSPIFVPIKSLDFGRVGTEPERLFDPPSRFTTGGWEKEVKCDTH